MSRYTSSTIYATSIKVYLFIGRMLFPGRP